MLNQHQTVRDSIANLNRPNPLAPHIVKLIGDKKKVKIADIGAGPLPTIGQLLKGVEVTIHRSDNQDFKGFWEKHQVTPAFGIEYQNMEQLSYTDNSFDIVHSANALDHTRDALAALKELIRVCKPGGYVYIVCNLDQLDTGHKHYWNAKHDGIFTNYVDSFDLKDFGFKIDFIDNGGESRYNRIIALLKKKSPELHRDEKQN